MTFHLALITGASSGIGEALAYLLTSKGISLILSGRNGEKLKKLAQDVQAKKIVVADLSTHEGRQPVIDVIREMAPDLIINNAGFGLYGEAISHPVSEQVAILEVNGAAVLELTLEGSHALVRAGKQGVILNVSSVAGELPGPGMSVYSASKSFVTMLSHSLDYELSPKGVEVLVSCPGMVDSDFSNRAARKKSELSGGPVMSVQFAAEQIWKQIETRKKKHIFNPFYRWSSWVAKNFTPRSVVNKLIYHRIKKRL